MPGTMISLLGLPSSAIKTQPVSSQASSTASGLIWLIGAITDFPSGVWIIASVAETAAAASSGLTFGPVGA